MPPSVSSTGCCRPRSGGTHNAKSAGAGVGGVHGSVDAGGSLAERRERTENVFSAKEEGPAWTLVPLRLFRPKHLLGNRELASVDSKLRNIR